MQATPTRSRRRNWNVRGAVMSTWHPTRLLTGYGWDAITAACLLGSQPPRNILMLGLGGGTVARQLLHLLPELHITAVDLDPRALQEAPRNLGSAAKHLTVIEADAYQWLPSAPGPFDVVIDDIYASGPEDVYRPRPMDRSLASQLRALTTPGGIVVANFVLGQGHRQPLSLARSAFRATFQKNRALKPPRGCNTILAGGDTLQPPSSLRAWRDHWGPRERNLWDQLRTASLR